ncbi:MAG: SUF system NifU family Fe-S cluster assembly protein [Verrucomicrobia bacterium]|nr:SUF system NifU family Fe-S cluster assembly protein [Verrucomicrobiota bacterium]
MSNASAELYQAVIDDHRRRPRNRGPLPAAHRVARRENPACGDLCTIYLQLDPDPANPTDPIADPSRIIAAHFTGSGCALSQASASLATTALTGRTAAEARQLAASVEILLRTGLPSPGSVLPAVSDLAALAAAHRYPARHACTLLAWQATLAALAPSA